MGLLLGDSPLGTSCDAIHFNSLNSINCIILHDSYIIYFLCVYLKLAIGKASLFETSMNLLNNITQYEKIVHI